MFNLADIFKDATYAKTDGFRHVKSRRSSALSIMLYALPIDAYPTTKRHLDDEYEFGFSESELCSNNDSLSRELLNFLNDRTSDMSYQTGKEIEFSAPKLVKL